MKLAAILIAALLCACVNPRKRFDEFGDRVVDAGPDAGTDGGEAIDAD